MTSMDWWVAAVLGLVGLVATLRLLHIGATPLVKTPWRSWIRAGLSANPERGHLLRLQDRLRRQRRELTEARAQHSQDASHLAARHDLLGVEKQAVEDARAHLDGLVRRVRRARRVNRLRRRQAKDMLESSRQELDRARRQYAQWQAEMARVRADIAARSDQLEHAEQQVEAERACLEDDHRRWCEQLQTDQEDMAGQRGQLEAKVREMSQFRLSLHDGHAIDRDEFAQP